MGSIFCAFMVTPVIMAQPIKIERKSRTQVPPLTAPAIPKPHPDMPPKQVMADLVVSNATITPSTPRQGKDMVQIDVTVKNTGNKTVPKVCSLAMDLSNQDTHPEYTNHIIPWYTNNIPQLSPGAEVRISRTITIPYTGNYKLSCLIITEGLQAGDENSQNNRFSKNFQVIQKPDPSDLALESLTPDNNNGIRIKMYNKGSSIPDIDFDQCRVALEVNETFYRNVELKVLDPTGLLKKGETGSWGASPRVYLEYIWPSEGSNGFTLRPGETYKVRVTLDVNHSILDSDWLNNSKTVVWHMTQ